MTACSHPLPEWRPWSASRPAELHRTERAGRFGHPVSLLICKFLAPKRAARSWFRQLSGVGSSNKKVPNPLLWTIMGRKRRTDQKSAQPTGGGLMKQQVLQQLAEHQGPFVTVSLDTSRNDANSARAIELRWRALADRIQAPWVPSSVLSELAAAATTPAGQNGSSGRLIVASATGIAVNLGLPEAPPRDEAVVGPAPHLLPLIRANRCHASYLLAVVDRAGADLELVSTFDRSAEHRTVTGSNDELHKVRAGLMSQRRIDARVEDSMERNAAEVAAELDVLTREHRPARVLLAGDQAAVAALHGAVSEGVRAIARKLNSGSRADGSSVEALKAEVAAERARYDANRRSAVVDRFRSAEARQTAAVQGVEDVVTALGRAQVEHLLLQDNPMSTYTVWMGETADQISLSEEALHSLGVAAPTRIRADAAIVWSTLAGGGDVTLLDEEDRSLTNGIGAVLRWSDASTPHDRAPSMPGHGAT